ncbi:unnamed protein product [Cuscuta epithymum]|uniref:Beta-glucosidase n=1 Tax=Cuscuta epithymum TaxID=186058 RepID=A0AAV0DA31_9ASTE|nr:unnamed protein product [Cuscuta epithymum]
MDFYWYEPMSNSTLDKAAAERAQSFFSNWYMDPIIYGTYPKEMKDLLGPLLPEFSKSDMQKLGNGLDFIGINHYTTIYAQDCLFSTCDPPMKGNNKAEGFAGVTMSKNGVPIGELTGLPDMANTPWGMENIITYVTKRYPNFPLYITENGYCDTTSNPSIEEMMNDTKRINYTEGYLDAIGAVIRKGADVRGYFLWSLMDNFEWAFGFSKFMGLYQVDRVTLKRTPKLSANWYKNFIEKHRRIGSKMMKTSE